MVRNRREALSLTGAINSFRDGLNQWLSVLVKLGFIVGITVFILWIGMSVWANATEDGGNPKPPSVAKAQYELFIRASGEKLMTDSYDVVGEGSYILHGFYRVTDGKWRFNEDDFPISEEDWGPLLIKER